MSKGVHDLWTSFLGPEDLSVASGDALDEIIRTLLVADRIDPWLFIANYEAIERQGAMSARAFLGGAEDKEPTRSARELLSPLDRPLAMPLWFLAAYPDVVVWQQAQFERCVDEEEATELMGNLLGVDFGDPDRIADDIYDAHGKNRPHLLRNLVASYKAATGKTLEVAAQGGSDDVYAAQAMLEALGTESNFTLIAENTTRFYLELSKSHRHRFRDISSMLAAAGFLDAMVYVLGEGRIGVEEIAEMARRSAPHGEHALLDFIVELEARIFECEEPNMDAREIREICEAERSNIARAVENTKAHYRGEAVFASAASCFMSDPEFGAVRKSLGISDQQPASAPPGRVSVARIVSRDDRRVARIVRREPQPRSGPPRARTLRPSDPSELARTSDGNQPILNAILIDDEPAAEPKPRRERGSPSARSGREKPPAGPKPPRPKATRRAHAIAAVGILAGGLLIVLWLVVPQRESQKTGHGQETPSAVNPFQARLDAARDEALGQDEPMPATHDFPASTPTPRPQAPVASGLPGEPGHPVPEQSVPVEAPGKVYMTNPKNHPGRIILEGGRDRNVSVGQRFEVLRDGERVAIVEAELILPNYTVARINERSEKPIREGDAVRLLPKVGN